jgi:hypothetical protein
MIAKTEAEIVSIVREIVSIVSNGRWTAAIVTAYNRPAKEKMGR